MNRPLVSRRGFIGGLVALGVLGLGAVGCEQAGGGKLRVGLIPIVDALPMYVAEAEGYFRTQGLEVELTLFGSALERDAALQAGQLDLELNDLISATLLNKDADGFRVVRLAYRGNPTLPMMLVLAAPNSQIKGPTDLRGATIAISGNTVIEYSTDRLLELAGIAPGDVQRTEVTKIPVRAEMLAKGQIAAATLPEPMASLAIQQGARRILDDGQSGVGLSVITARKDLVQRDGPRLKRFLAAYEQGVRALASAPDKYRALFVEKAKIPDALKDTLPIPPYPPAQVPSREEVTAVLAWAQRKALVSRVISYEEMVDGSCLPEPGASGR